MKVPQILSIIQDKSTAGVSSYTQYLETAVYAQAAATAMAKGLDFSLYGENVLLAGQNALLILVLWAYSNKIGLGEKAVATALLAVWAFALFSPGALGAVGL